MLDNFMKEFGKELELEGSLATETPGVYAFKLEEEVTITLTSLPQGFSLSCALAACPKTNREAFFTQTMLANLFGQGTRGGVLGLSEDGNMLTLSKVVDYTADYKDFRDTVEDFINIVDYWRHETLNHK